MTTPLSGQQLTEIRTEVDRLREAQRAYIFDTAELKRENDRLRAELERQDGEARFWHFEYRAAMDNYLGENQKLRQELADTAMFRDFNQRSADHIATKRDLAEAAIAAWDRDEISGDAAVLMIREALGDGPAPDAA